MTESQWLACDDPRPMIEFLIGTPRSCERIWLLFMAADGRHQDYPMTSKEKWRWRRLVTGLEIWADTGRPCRKPPGWAALGDAQRAAILSINHSRLFEDASRKRAFRMHSSLLRELFGNPLRPINLNSAWLTSTVVSLARGIYDERAFESMPILADALQDAGCDNAAVLDHCRQPGDHVRGCFVVDLLLGKG